MFKSCFIGYIYVRKEVFLMYKILRDIQILAIGIIIGLIIAIYFGLGLKKGIKTHIERDKLIITDTEYRLVVYSTGKFDYQEN